VAGVVELEAELPGGEAEPGRDRERGPAAAVEGEQDQEAGDQGQVARDQERVVAGPGLEQAGGGDAALQFAIVGV
jgi:hypothetical protein